MTDELIERFFNKQCTAPEAAKVSQYLKAHPEVLDKYLNAREWFGSGSQPMPGEFWKENWTEITVRRKAQRKTIWIKRAAAAAVIVISAGLLYKSLPVTENPAPLVTVQKPAPAPVRKITANNTAAMMPVVLPDSSSVMLSPGSLITYNILFDDDRRNITLDGEGRFNVRKNERKPFTVFAGGLATTALGTEFTINTINNNVSVKLHTGKVLIVATGQEAKHWAKNVILKPGQQLNYDTRKMIAEVGPIRKNVISDRTLAIERPGGNPPEQARVLNFVNAPLPDVMTRLTRFYQQRIIFDRAALEEMNFTGTISHDDSLEVVLKVIAQMNNLELSHDDNGYGLIKKDK